MMQEYARVARPFFVMLAIVTVGRWLMGTVFPVPYDRGTAVFSIVTLTLFASLFSTVFVRRWLGWRLATAAGFAMFMAVVAQLVIWSSTVGFLRLRDRELLRQSHGPQPADRADRLRGRHGLPRGAASSRTRCSTASPGPSAGRSAGCCPRATADSPP